MICVDTSVWIPFLAGNTTPKTIQLSSALDGGYLWMAPPILLELISSPELTSEERQLFASVPMLEPKPGLWERAGYLRRTLLRKRLKARSMDCLIAQSCMDYQIPLLTNDLDFRHFSKMGLKLIDG